MADINNFRQLDFQEAGEPTDSDRVLIVVIENGKAVGAKNYDLSKLKGHISAEAMAYLEECRSIESSLSGMSQTISNKTQLVENISNEVEENKSAAVSAATTAINAATTALSRIDEAENLLEDARSEMIDTLEQTVTSTESGGINEFAIIQKNGNKKSLKVRNGEKGEAGISGSVFGFYIDRSNGHLYCNYVDNEAPNFSIRNGHLIYEF